MVTAMNKKYIQPFLELIDVNKNIEGLTTQKKNHEISIKNISDLVKDLKANRHKNMKRLIGGTLIIDVDNKKAISDLMKQKTDMETAVKVINEQLMHREDNFNGILIRAYKSLIKYMPADVLKELSDD